MTRYLLGSMFTGFAVAIPMAASPQVIPATVTAVVDRERIAATCTQCVAANGQLRAQVQQYQAREIQLTTPLRTESQAIGALLQALPQGQQPDAATQARIRTFQAQQQAAEAELGRRQETLRRNQQFLGQQILQRIDPLVGQVTRERGANLAVDIATTLVHNPALNVTDAVLALMNQNAAPFSVTAPPPQQPVETAPAAARPAAPAATPLRPRPRPEGR